MAAVGVVVGDAVVGVGGVTGRCVGQGVGWLGGLRGLGARPPWVVHALPG